MKIVNFARGRVCKVGRHNLRVNYFRIVACYDANGLAYTRNKQRYTWHLPKPALLCLRRFDEIGEQQGQIAARAAMKRASYSLTDVRTAPIPPPASRARKDQINARRNRIAAEDRAQGVVRRSPPFVGCDRPDYRNPYS